MTQIDETQNPSIPMFQIGTRVKCNKRSGCRLVGEVAEVIGIKYVRNEYWSGWTYKITNQHLDSPMDVGEIWLDAAPTLEKVKSIAEINDRFRQGDSSLGIVHLTPKVRALTFEKQAELMELVKGSLWFGTECNEPDSERNFGEVTLDGKGYYWQIEYKDPTLSQQSEDPADPNVTKRTMTLVREDEY